MPCALRFRQNDQRGLSDGISPGTSPHNRVNAPAVGRGAPHITLCTKLHSLPCTLWASGRIIGRAEGLCVLQEDMALVQHACDAVAAICIKAPDELESHHKNLFGSPPPPRPRPLLEGTQVVQTWRLLANMSGETASGVCGIQLLGSCLVSLSLLVRP